jgi:hypothetical protein
VCVAKYPTILALKGAIRALRRRRYVIVDASSAGVLAVDWSKSVVADLDARSTRGAWAAREDVDCLGAGCHI